ncbi:fructose-2,6-bisphosphatase tigar [Plakobranchus ocellatus]|uniref:Fructose-2,6-bisphosphatase TIGAR n=1 Tax=Plakobranchus ocellatus TaxID=259542 RepID=A0AAV3XXQ4_9GAST|nr:fructose-2,6-bisphosphatase tigar [Plakobranchus ocellatus]
MEKIRLFTVTLVRHGETLSNRNKILQGQLDTQLSDIGEEQAKLVGKRLKEHHFTHVFSSDLSRAVNTAQHILAENKKTTCDLILDPRLRERDFGCLEGRPLSDFVKAQEESGLPSHLFTPEGAETIDQVSHRAREFFKDLCKMMAEPVKSLSTDSKECVGNLDSPSSPVNGPESQTLLPKKVHSGALMDASNLIDLLPPAENLSASPAHPAVPASSSSSSASMAAHESPSEESGDVLIVSHGLLLHELKKIVLKKFKGVLEGPLAHEVQRKSPNTGVTQVTMAVNYKYNKLKSQCTEIHAINNISHLEGSRLDLFSNALFKGAL